MTTEEKLVAINAYLKLKGRKAYYEIGPCREGDNIYRTAMTKTRFRRVVNPYWLSQVSVKRALEHIQLSLKQWR